MTAGARKCPAQLLLAVCGLGRKGLGIPLGSTAHGGMQLQVAGSKQNLGVVGASKDQLLLLIQESLGITSFGLPYTWGWG